MRMMVLLLVEKEISPDNTSDPLWSKRKYGRSNMKVWYQSFLDKKYNY